MRGWVENKWKNSRQPDEVSNWVFVADRSRAPFVRCRSSVRHFRDPNPESGPPLRLKARSMAIIARSPSSHSTLSANICAGCPIMYLIGIRGPRHLFRNHASKPSISVDTPNAHCDVGCNLDYFASGHLDPAKRNLECFLERGCESHRGHRRSDPGGLQNLYLSIHENDSSTLPWQTADWTTILGPSKQNRSPHVLFKPAQSTLPQRAFHSPSASLQCFSSQVP